MKLVSTALVLALHLAACVPPGYYNGGNGGYAAPAATNGTDGTTGAAPGGQVPGDQQSGPPPEHLQGASLAWITNDPDANESNPRVAPDGQSLLFVDWASEVVDGAYTGGYEHRTLVGHAVSSNAARTVFTSARSQIYSPSWVADGSGFVFMSNSMGTWNLVRSLSRAPNAATSIVVRGTDAPEIGTVDVSRATNQVAFDANLGGTRQIVVAHLDGSSFTVLTEGANPRFSPDGSRLAFNRVDENGLRHVYLIDVASGANLVQLTNGDSDDHGPTWSPDGNTLVFASNYGWNQWQNGNAENTYNLFAVRSDGTQLTQVTTGIATSHEPDWAADGWIYFSTNTNGSYDIYAVAAPQL